jgi:hypothetical protein
LKLLVKCVYNVTSYTVLQDVFDVVRGKINPVLKWKNEVRAECIKQNIKYDKYTMEVEGTLEPRYIIRISFSYLYSRLRT